MIVHSELWRKSGFFASVIIFALTCLWTWDCVLDERGNLALEGKPEKRRLLSHEEIFLRRKNLHRSCLPVWTLISRGVPNDTHSARNVTNRFRGVGRAAINCCAVRTESQKKIFNWGGALSAVIELESETDFGSVPFWRSNQEMVRLPGGKKGNGNLSQISAQLTCDAVYLLEGNTHKNFSQFLYFHTCMHVCVNNKAMSDSKKTLISREREDLPEKKHPFFLAKQN